MRTRFHYLVVCGFALVTLAACSGDSTGPAGNSLTGSWTYAAPNMTGTLSGVTVTCSFSGVPITITQTGQTFTGSANGGSLSCSAGGQTESGSFGSAIIVNGEIAGSSVEFDFDSPDWHHTGQVNGNSMTGQATAIIETSSATVVLRGSWSAAR